MSNRRIRQQAQKSARPNNVTGKGAVNGKSKDTRDFLMDGPRSSVISKGKGYDRKVKHKGRGYED